MKKNIKLNKVKYKSIFFICMLSMLILAMTGCSSMSKYEKAYRDYNENFKEVILDEVDQSTYDTHMSDLKANIDSKKASECDKIIESLELLLQNSKKRSVEYLSNREEELNLKGQQISLYEAEQITVSDYKNEVNSLINKNQYVSANKVYDKYEAFLDAIDSSLNYSLEVSQVDVSEYPNVKLYVSIKNLLTGESIDNLEYNDFYISEDIKNSGYNEIKIDKAIQLDQEENLNIDIVADVSSSMDVFAGNGTNMSISKQAMTSLINQIQFNVGDKAGLLSFSDDVVRNTYFTNDKSELINTVNNLPMGNLTSLYDALYASINQIVSSEGAKCIIAFTDGEDNDSRVSYEAVKELAQKYKIPIYIIGIGGGLNNGILDDIATSTGGFYRNITDASYMAGVYESIFKEQKSQYLLEYKTSESSKENVIRNLYIRYMSGQLITRNVYSYSPQEFLEATTASAKYNQNGYIFADSDSRYLTITDLQNLSDRELRLARNEIYARRGRKFNDSELQSYFNGCSWYSGTIEPDAFVDEDRFNNYERANAYLILEYENLKNN